MAKEIERKFLLRDDSWRKEVSSSGEYRQGYLPMRDDGTTVRIRIAEGRGILTIKGPTAGVTRSEFEYGIPIVDATALLDQLCARPFIQKTRHIVIVDGHRFEVDEFCGYNEGLIVAEIELPSEDAPFPRPPWLGREVSDDPRYFNANLAKRPYNTW